MSGAPPWPDLPPVIGERLRDAFGDIFRHQQELSDEQDPETSKGPGDAGAA